VALDGTIAGSAENLLIYATSNRRHLMPEFMDENLEAKHVGGEIHPGETTEEKISLSERFGIWLSFYPFDQDEYLDIAVHWVEALGGKADEAVRKAALLFALERGSRSGRVAWQFARDHVGRQGGRPAGKRK
jgi:predicted AAA+ superfamily ATPase